MKIRSIICPSSDDVEFLRAWLPSEITESSYFFFPSELSNAPSTARRVLRSHPVQALLIRNAYTTDPQLICDLGVYAEERLSISASTLRFEIEVVSPTLMIMLFETPQIFNSIFREKATDYLHLMGSYDPERAILTAGTSPGEIMTQIDESIRELLRTTPTAQRILARIARLDVKPLTHGNGEDDAWHHHSPLSTAMSWY